MKLKWALVFFLAGLLLGGAFVWAVTQKVITIHTVCTIKTVGVGVYADSNCTIPVTSIDWGIMEPSQTKETTVFIRNEGNVASNLTIRTESWEPPEAEQYITLANDYDNRTLNPMDVVQVLFTLTIKPSIVGIKQFAFDIVVAIYG